MPANSRVTISNMALLRLNGNLIASFNDGTKESTACAMAWDMCRRALLRAHPWNFATKLATLPQLTNLPDFQFAFAYQVPSDSLRVLRAYQATPWEVVGQTIYSNDGNIDLYYIYDVEDETQFDTVFADLLALKIAIAITGSINADLSILPQLHQEYELRFKEAKQYNGQENIPLQWDDGTWSDSRWSI